MNTKLIITERQFNMLKSFINENTMYENMVKTIVSDLDANYKPIMSAIREDGEYKNLPMFEVNFDGNQISPKELYEYIKKKYNTGKDFTQQVIKDWAFGKIKNNQLSKNVPLN